MASAPQIYLRDGSGQTTTQLSFTTNKKTIVISGELSPDSVSLQVSIDGAPFTVNPNLVLIELNTFTFPNPNIYPEGYSLKEGTNTFSFRVIDIVGGVSATSTVNVGRVASVVLEDARIPSGIKILRNRDTVTINVAEPVFDLSSTTGGPVTDGGIFVGFNFYASSSPAGATGYFKINEKPVSLENNVYDETVYESTKATALWDTTTTNQIRITVEEIDEFDNIVQTPYVIKQNSGIFSPNMRLTYTVDNYTVTKYASFTHNREGGPNQINSEQFNEIEDDAPLYYVVTGIYYDTLNGIEYETPYSQEFLGTPLIIDTAIRDLPGRSQIQIVTDYTANVIRVNKEISLIPGSTTRDVSIDPFSSETERVWFLYDFVHRSQSFLTLLQIDDPNNDGVSDLVADTAYKSALKAALGFTSDAACQALIDTQFDKLAANVNRTRFGGRTAIGQVVFYTTTRPLQDIPIAAGTIVSAGADPENGQPPVRFIVSGAYTMLASNIDSYYNFNTKRYELTANIVCEQPGLIGNRTPNTINNAGGIATLSVTNVEPTVFGLDQETNSQLATRAMIAFASVDTGTEMGYLNQALNLPTVLRARVVKSGDPLMMRDWDEVRKKHIGGKVDIWIKGVYERSITENFAFSFEIARDINCKIIDVTNLIFRVLDSRVTVEHPLIEILNNPLQGLGVRNATIGQDYDLTGVTILDFETFKINTNIPQPTTFIDDLIIADYRYRSANKFVFSFQPVRRITSVVGEVAGPLTAETNYKLYKTDDPLLEGESPIAKNYVTITPVNGNPTGSQITINDEKHVLLGLFEEPLNSIGINTKTIRVFNSARTVEYVGPENSNPDFNILAGTDRTPPKIIRVQTGSIPSGTEVSVDYVKDENFTVSYVINDTIQKLQQMIETMRHVTADVLVKQSVTNEFEIETTVQLKKGAVKENTDPKIRNNVSIEVSKKDIGNSIAQSDVINEVDSTEGVDFEVVPLAKMAYADGAQKLREPILSTSARLPSLDIGGQFVWILTTPLSYPTIDFGGGSTQHKGVFIDEIISKSSETLLTVGNAPNQSFIIGNNGAIITGYSDDATLINQGFTTQDQINAERLRRTANHVVVSLLVTGILPDEPSNHKFSCSYNVYNDQGTHDIIASQVESLELGNFTITYRNNVLGVL